MPALITHDTFGLDAYDRHFDLIGGKRDAAEAFFLGNQGPDPLFYLVINPRMPRLSHLGHVMHSERPSELLAGLKRSLSILDEASLPIGNAYALGFLCHYALDSHVHPLVFFNEYSLCDAGEPGLTRSNGGEVHGVIESELDELVLSLKRKTSIAEFNPAQETLLASDETLLIIGRMYAYIALTVYGTFIPENAFANAVKSFRRGVKLFYSPTGVKRAVVGRIEELARPYSFFRAMSHRPDALAESHFANDDHLPWTNPYTDEESEASFWDLYEDALDATDNTFSLFDDASFDTETARTITDERDFSGRPVVATLVSVEDGPAVSSRTA